MTPDQTLAEIEAAARAATEGPWQTMAGDPLAVDAHSGVYVAKMTGATPVTELAANARFIVLACNNAAAMVGEIRALREALRKTTMDAMRFKGICVQADLWANTPSPAYWAKIESRPVPDHGSGPISTKD